MTSFRRARCLTCFYCNRPTSTANDGNVRRFECPHCDATNYLDKNGEITDPPVSTTAREPAQVRYAAVRPSATLPTCPPKSPLSSTSSSIFCNTCLQNQHLYTSSLAQYLPDDPNAPDYAERERTYYRYRKGLEKLYPQICAGCEPRVRARMEQAAYTAKTDLLRRMIDRTNDGRKIKRAGWLDVVSSAGRFLWYVGLLLQVAWHLGSLAELATAYVGSAQPSGWMQGVVSKSYYFTMHLLPSSDRLIFWSTATGFMGVWWNPCLVQSVRGFTKHIVGLKTWYYYQVMTMAVRLVLTRLLRPENLDPNELNTQLGGHLFAMSFSIFIAILGPRSVRIDITPLFKVPTRTVPHPEPREAKDEAQGTKNMSQLLDEILRVPSSTASTLSSLGRDSTAFPGYATKAKSDHREADFQLRSLDISSEAPATSSTVQYDHQMDWSPTQSQHRAFATHGQRRTTAFGDTPTAPKSGPFWYRVPPAPITPAQRLRNPPNQPLLRKSPVTTQDGVAFGGPRGEDRQEKGTTAFGGRRQASPGEQGRDASGLHRSQVAFAEPSFFPQPEQNDPRNSLLDLFGESFSLSAEEQEKRRRGWLGGGSLLDLVSGKKT